MAIPIVIETTDQPNCLEVMFEEWPLKPASARFRGFVYDRQEGVMLFGCEAGTPGSVRSAVFAFVAENISFRRVA